MSLSRYHQKRNFKKTAEPIGKINRKKSSKLLFVIQKHAASHLHYDLRLELAGVLKSWAVPKGPSLDPSIKRLAMHVEDHPLDYGTFEGIIPQGEYGGGTVMLWDKGEWVPQDEDPIKAYKNGNLTFIIKGKKLQGKWKLIRLKTDEKAWLFMKLNDDYAKSQKKYDVTLREPNSVKSKKTLDAIAESSRHVWGKQGLETTKKTKVKKKS